jgi:hypothetical protein
MEHNSHQENNTSSSTGMWMVMALIFAPAALTLAWVIHLASAGM